MSLSLSYHTYIYVLLMSNLTIAQQDAVFYTKGIGPSQNRNGRCFQAMLLRRHAVLRHNKFFPSVDLTPTSTMITYTLLAFDDTLKKTKLLILSKESSHFIPSIQNPIIDMHLTKMSYETFKESEYEILVERVITLGKKLRAAPVGDKDAYYNSFADEIIALKNDISDALKKPNVQDEYTKQLKGLTTKVALFLELANKKDKLNVDDSKFKKALETARFSDWEGWEAQPSIIVKLLFFHRYLLNLNKDDNDDQLKGEIYLSIKKKYGFLFEYWLLLFGIDDDEHSRASKYFLGKFDITYSYMRYLDSLSMGTFSWYVINRSTFWENTNLALRIPTVDPNFNVDVINRRNPARNAIPSPKQMLVFASSFQVFAQQSDASATNINARSFLDLQGLDIKK